MDFFFGPFGLVILGGGVIGLALAILRVVTGRVLSGSRMLGSLLGGREGLAAASIAFIGGLVISPSIMTVFGHASPPPFETGWAWLVAGGLCVGVGARLGDGSLFAAISGLAQRSRQAVAAILAIIAGAAVSIYLRQVISLGGVA